MIWIHNTITKEKTYINKSDNIPVNWSIGMGKRK